MKNSCKLLAFLLILSSGFVRAHNITQTLPATPSDQPSRDLYADTWVGTDALGRSLPVSAGTGPVKTGQRRVVGMFYIMWHTDEYAALKGPTTDVTKVLKADTNARHDANNAQWKENFLHWGEPENGYYLSKDEYVIRKDISMLADAAVDVLVMDVTNAVRYWDQWDTLFTTMQQMKAQGNKVPQFCFWAFNGPVVTVVQDLYDKIYKLQKYKDLWFYWDGKPLLLYNGDPRSDANGQGVDNPNPHFDSSAITDKKNPHYGDPDYTERLYKDYTKEVKHYFTRRMMWWGYYEWAGKRFIGTEDNWSFGYDLGDSNVRRMPAADLASTHVGKREEAAVTPAQHPSSLVGKSWSRETGEPLLNAHDLPDSAYVPWLHQTVAHPEGYGIYFQQRWDEALKTDPEFLYLNDWNEWTAGKYAPSEGKTTNFMRRHSTYFFVDQYNAEFNRSIQPMKGGYTDNYYMQMAENIRKYKGVRDIPQLTGFNHINIDGSFSDWKNVAVEFRDTRGDVIHRAHKGYGSNYYTDSSGRNDIVTSKVAVDNNHIYFYAETASPLTASSGSNWMLLFVDADQNPSTGWNGYDFLINKTVTGNKSTTLFRYDSSKKDWVKVSGLNYRCKGNQLEIAVPRAALVAGKIKFSFDFHWCDNPDNLTDIISLCTSGDSAPNRRFNYRCNFLSSASQ